MEEVRDPLPNPFDSRQQAGKDKTLKWCAWDVLTRRTSATDKEIADEILAMGLRSDAKSASVSKQCAEERKHFVRVGAQWTLRLLAGVAELRGDGLGQQLASPAAADIDAVAGAPHTELQSTIAATAQAGGKPRKRPARPREVTDETFVYLPPRKPRPAAEWWVSAPSTSESPAKRHKKPERSPSGEVAGGVDGDAGVHVDKAQQQKQNQDSQGHADAKQQQQQRRQERAVVAEAMDEGDVGAEQRQGLPEQEAEGGGKEGPQNGQAHAEAQTASDVGALPKDLNALVGPEARPLPEGEQPAEESSESASLDVGQPAVAATGQGFGGLALGEEAEVQDTTASEEELPVEEAPEQQQQQQGVGKVVPAPAPAAAAAAAAGVPDAAALQEKAGPSAAQPVAVSFIIPKRQPGVDAPDKQPPAKSSPPPFRIPKAHDAAAAKEREGAAHHARRESAARHAPPRPPAHEHRRPDLAPPWPESLVPWKLMMQQNNSALARHRGKKWEFRRPIVAPQPVDPATISERQRREWAKVRRQYESVPKTFKEAVPVNPYPRLPPHITHVRVMHCSNSTYHACVERSVFPSNHQADTEGMQPLTTLVLLHNFDTRRVHGCYLAKGMGTNLDTSFGSEWPYQVRVEPIHLFDPLPSEMLEPFIPRRIRDGKPMKFFEKGCSGAQSVWHLFQYFHNKL